MLKRASITLALLLAAAPVPAQVITDGSLGPAQSLAGPDFAITADLGRIAGANLFHSFRRLNLSSGQSATFSGPAGIANIFSRVTGGASTIDGTIRSTIAGADLFLVNPAGIMFGPNARLDVSGGFHASTATSIDFEDGARFWANTASDSQFSTAAPAAFGFISTASGPITVQSGAALNPGSGQPVTLAGNGLEIAGQVQTVSGSIRLSSLASPGNVPLDITQPTTGTRGEVAIVGGQVRLLGPGPGIVRVEAADLTLDAGNILSVNAGGADATGGILVESASVTGRNGAQIATTTAGSGKSGDVSVNTGTLSLSEASVIAADTVATGDGGRVAVTADSIDLSGSAEIHSNTGTFAVPAFGGDVGGVTVAVSGAINLTGQGSIGSTSFAAGNAGPVIVSADSIRAIGTIDPVTQAVAGIGSVTIGSGNANDVTVSARTIELRSNATITASTFGAGDGGSVSVTADSILLAGLPNSFETGIQSNSGDVITGQNNVQLGAAGNVLVQTSTLQVLDFASVASNAFGQNPAGSVTVRATDITAAAETVNDGQPVQLLFTGIFTNSQPTATAAASGGTVDVSANTINVLGTASISASTFSPADGGEVRVVGGDIRISGRFAAQSAGIASQALNSGAAGKVTVNANNLLIEKNGVLNSGTLSGGTGGEVVANISGSLTINGANNALQTGIIADVVPVAFGVSSTGSAGNITVNAPTATITLTNGGTISSSTFSKGNAGDVAVFADTINIAGVPGGFDTGILSRTVPEPRGGNLVGDPFVGNGGSVTVVAGDINLSRNGLISSTTFSNSPAGNVSVTANRMLTIVGLDNGALTGISSSTFFLGNDSPSKIGDAGSVTVSAGGIDIRPFGQINSSTATIGRAGSVSVDAGWITITGTQSLLGNDATTQTGIFSGAGVTATGDGGSVTVGSAERKPDITVNQFGSIQAATAGTGSAGTVTIDARTLNVIGRNARISSDALRLFAGAAGDVAVRADSVRVANGGAISSSTISGFGGDGGDVRIEAASLTVAGAGQVSATSRAPIVDLGRPGDAGSVAIFVGALTLTSGGSVTTIALNSGGGRMVIAVDDIAQLIGGRITSTVSSGAGNGGDVNLVGTIPETQVVPLGAENAPPIGPISDAQLAAAAPIRLVVLQDSLIQANAIDGTGGDISIRAGNILLEQTLIQATSQRNVDGTIRIDAPDTDAASGLAVLPTALVDAAQRLAQQCAARGGRTLASFTGVGRGRVPLAPGAPVPATYLADLGRGAATASAGVAPRLAAMPVNLHLDCQPAG